MEVAVAVGGILIDMGKMLGLYAHYHNCCASHICGMTAIFV